MHEMKKVLFTATVDSHILHFHIPYLKLFKENGYEVHVATNGDETIPYCDVKHKIPFEKSPIKFNNLKAIKLLRIIIDYEKFDMIHCHTPMGSVVTRIAAMKSRKINKTRVIYTAHGFHFYKGAPLLNWLIFYPVEKMLSKYTDTLITINNEDYELAKNKFKCKDIRLVNGVGIDTKKFNFDMTEDEKNKLRKSIGLNKDDYVIIYVAEISKRKNQTMAINVIKKLSEKSNKIKLLLIGKDSQNEYYQKITQEFKIEDKVKFLGYRNDIPKLIKISNMAISTAKQEGLPVNIMEYMNEKLPIIATNCRGNRDLIKEYELGKLVEIDDIETMVKNIQEVINKDKYLEIKNENLEEYKLDNIMKEYQKIYFIKEEN